MSRCPLPLSSSRKRPCSHCRKWFQPDARVGKRQRFCSSPGCQQARQRRQEAEWRRDNPTYFTGRRWEAARAKTPPTVPQSPPPLGKVPWDLVQMEMGAQGAVILGLLVGVLLRHAQMQRRV